MSTVLWKQEQAHFGLEQAGREMEERHVWLLSGLTPMYQQGIHNTLFELIFGAHHRLNGSYNHLAYKMCEGEGLK